MPGKRVQFDDETWQVTDVVLDEAFMLKNHT